MLEKSRHFKNETRRKEYYYQKTETSDILPKNSRYSNVGWSLRNPKVDSSKRTTSGEDTVGNTR